MAVHVCANIEDGRLTRTRGFTLVEVLVAVVVLSLGLLGMAALFVEALRASRSALNRTQAINLAADLGDRMRANREPEGAYDCGEPCDPASGGNDMASVDLGEWMAAVAELFPSGAVEVDFAAGTATTPGTYVITVTWKEPGQVEAMGYQLRVEI